MKNKISDLRNHLFEAIEMLKNNEIDVEKAQAISNIGQTIVNSVKVELQGLKILGRNKSAFVDEEDTKKFLPEEIEEDVPFVRPPAIYSNQSPLKLASEGLDK